MNQRVLVVGCGYVGSQVGVLLVRDGWSVYGLRRDPSRLPVGIHPIAADLRDQYLRNAISADDSEDTRLWDAVVYCVGADSRAVEDYQLAYMDGPARIIAALGGADRLKHTSLVFVSSTAVYAETAGGWVDETSALLPRSDPHAHALISGEEAFLSSAPNAYALRLSGIYGPGRTSLLQRVREGEKHSSPNAKSDRYTNRVHRDDAAQLIRWLLTERPVPGVFNGSDGEAPPLSTVISGIGSLVGAPVRPFGGGLQATGKRVSNAKATSAGFRFEYPTFMAGYRALIRHSMDTSS